MKGTLELYDSNGIQYRPGYRNLKFAKTAFGGEDLWLTFVLDRTTTLDWPDIAYGNDVIYRLGLIPIFVGEMRQIEQDLETITVKALGNWIHLDDNSYGGQGKLWVDTRYGKWKPTTQNQWPSRAPDRNRIDTNNRLYSAPEAGESFGSPNYNSAGLYYYCPFDNVKRVTFDYDVVIPDNWRFCLYSWNADWTAPLELWFKKGVSAIGPADITLATEKPMIEFCLFYDGPETIFDGRATWCKKFDGGIFTDYREQAQAADIIVLDTLGGAGDYLYIASAKTPFSSIRITVSNEENLNASVMSAEYWNGAAWVNLPITDGTADAGKTLNKTGDIAFERPPTWAPTAIDGITCWWIRLSFSAALSASVDLRQIETKANTGDIYAMVTNLKIYGSIDTTPTSSDVASDIVDQIQAATPISDDKSLIETVTLTLEPLFYERAESCHKALKDATSFGDENNKLLVWGVEPGGDRIYLRKPDRSKVRYVVPPYQATTLAATGQTDQKFLTAGWGQYTDANNEMQFTAKYYAHVTAAGIIANTTSTGDDLASTVYGAKREAPVNFGRVSTTLAVEFLKQHLIEHGHPRVKSSYQVYGPVQDLLKGGAWIDLPEMEMGYIVQIPHFRAVEAEGAAGVDLREWDTTFLLVGMEYDDEKGTARLIPEGASEDLARLIQFSREFGITQTEELLRKGG